MLLIFNPEFISKIFISFSLKVNKTFNLFIYLNIVFASIFLGKFTLSKLIKLINTALCLSCFKIKLVLNISKISKLHLSINSKL